ncbi:N(2)-acetyl-L-2,4-diaminobutanoate deacetylase DoeB2 [uncultured Methylophaga sp.]|uniref:N(2)-acetyl-L-2,4-diaminobutanoate deacetylase DoeB2 n=1 Tax=uncultured Methylophaga sp. TaxID=285271 RepID=UPI00262EA6D0|nr:N(2)-acetyl-L-2,4-diaminobutanoate deacetylase DoeB2 [uncultured Methylophaga sp.]
MGDTWQQAIDTALQLRHQLHRHPELGWQEVKTAELIRNELSSLDIPWQACAELGTLGRLNPHGKGPHIALRADMDALPIVEQTEHEWRSHHEGCMHACGHDGHTATLLASARWLKSVESQLPGPVTLLFQPAEEGGHGAKKMIDDGALEGIDFIYGWHNWPAIPFGKLVCPDNIIMCGNGTFEIELHGEGGHASQPELCRDPVLAASAVTMGLQQIVSRRIAPQHPVVISVASIEAPSAATVIPATARIGGSIRVPDLQTRKQVNQLISDIATQTAAAYGVRCDVTHFPRYEATINHAAQAANVRQAWQQDHGDDSLDQSLLLPVMASEDFSYYLQQIPGAFALVGADDGPAHQAVCHSPHYDFNDRLIPLVTRLYARLVGAPLAQ